MTQPWEGERFADGRPRVPDDILRRMKLVTTEEAWGVLRRHGYNFQFAGDWQNLHADRVLVGRAVTAAFMPMRPGVPAAVEAVGQADGRARRPHPWALATLA